MGRGRPGRRPPLSPPPGLRSEDPPPGLRSEDPPPGLRPEDPPPGSRADLVFAALADPTRRRLLDELSSAGPRTATELAPGYPMSRQAVVKHLGTLASAGLLAAERDGRDVRYRLVPDPLADATTWLADIGRRWDDRLAALARHLGAGPEAGPVPPTGSAT